MKKLKEKLEKRQENGAEKVEMSYTYRAICAPERLRTLSENGGWGEKTSATKREGALETCLKSSSHTARNSIYF